MSEKSWQSPEGNYHCFSSEWSKCLSSGNVNQLTNFFYCNWICLLTQLQIMSISLPWLLQNHCFTTKLLSLLSGFLAINQSNYMHDNSSICNYGNNTLLLLLLLLLLLVIWFWKLIYHWFTSSLMTKVWRKRCTHDKCKFLKFCIDENQSIHILWYFLYMHQRYGYYRILHCKSAYLICACHSKIMVTFIRIPWSTMMIFINWTNQKYLMSM